MVSGLSSSQLTMAQYFGANMTSTRNHLFIHDLTCIGLGFKYSDIYDMTIPRGPALPRLSCKNPISERKM